MNETSILTSIKQQLGITEEYEHFDGPILNYINLALADLMQIGVGEYRSFVVSDKSTQWSDFIDDTLWYAPMIPQYVYAKVKLKFDPPTSSSHQEALQETIRETEFRIGIATGTTIKE